MQEKNAFRLINKYRSAIMGVAALWILFFHEWIPTMEGHWRAYAVECFVKQIGFCGVDFFLFLSGMGLVYAIQKYSVITFYKRRLMRVFIPFMVIAVAMAIVQDWNLATWASNLFGVNFYTKSIYSFYGLDQRFLQSIYCSQCTTISLRKRQVSISLPWAHCLSGWHCLSGQVM